jgi:hypothetical protein
MILIKMGEVVGQKKEYVYPIERMARSKKQF